MLLRRAVVCTCLMPSFSPWVLCGVWFFAVHHKVPSELQLHQETSVSRE